MRPLRAFISCGGRIKLDQSRIEELRMKAEFAALHESESGTFET
jgi:hypothetical protein